MLARSSSRNGVVPRVLAIHTTEGIMRATDLRAWARWSGSSHASADETGALLTPAEGFVSYERAAWTLRSGNAWSENIELCGFAKWKRGDWLARPLLLDACARWLADRSKARGIPLVKLTPKEYAAGRSGVIGHHDHTVGYSDGTHWDPGPEFPYDVVLDSARAYAAASTPGRDWFDMATKEDLVSVLRSEAVSGAADWGIAQRPDGSWPVGAQALALMTRAVTEVLRTEAVSGAADTGRLVQALSEKLADTPASAAGTLTREDVKAAVREFFADATTPGS